MRSTFDFDFRFDDTVLSPLLLRNCHFEVTGGGLLTSTVSELSCLRLKGLKLRHLSRADIFDEAALRVESIEPARLCARLASMLARGVLGLTYSTILRVRLLALLWERDTFSLASR